MDSNKRKIPVFSVARRLEWEFGVVRLSAGEAMRMVLQGQPKTELAIAMNSQLKQGLTVPDELVVASLEVMLMDMKCQTRGCAQIGF